MSQTNKITWGTRKEYRDYGNRNGDVNIVEYTQLLTLTPGGKASYKQDAPTLPATVILEHRLGCLSGSAETGFTIKIKFPKGQESEYEHTMQALAKMAHDVDGADVFAYPQAGIDVATNTGVFNALNVFARTADELRQFLNQSETRKYLPIEDMLKDVALIEPAQEIEPVVARRA